ncbi:hypothetical protein BDN72DRAFT_730369, partial [Pluteus cervinus]
SEGTRWTRCMHFQRHLVVAIADCSSSQCERSYTHNPSCRQTTCTKNFGEEIQRDIDSVADYCFVCKAAQARQ